MQESKPIHPRILHNVQEIKKHINTQEFCKLHGISESKFSRFPSPKFIEDLQLFDYMVQFYHYSKKE